MNIRSLIVSISVLCLSFALVAAAGAQGTTATPSSPDTHAQSAPGTQPPTSPGPSSSQSSTGSQSAAPSQGSAGTSANSGQSSSNSVEDELNLTQDQKQKIAEVVDDENKQISTVRNDTSMSMEQKQQKVLQIRQEGAPRIKAILTPDQLQKLSAIQQRMRAQQQGGAGANAPQSSPQGTAPQSAPQGSSPQH